MRHLLGVPLQRAVLALAAVLLFFDAQGVLAARKTVCTITVNSADEKEAFRRNLPASQFEFVELVEHGRPDWLESARQRGVRCDILIISGHYDGGDYAGGNEFFSERVDTHEYLPVDEMERVACSEPDNGMFSRLSQVYLFGCNTLNPEALRSTPGEIARTLQQTGLAPSDADKLARQLSPRYADSSRDRMRHIFKGVPAIYGFSSVAPLGPLAASHLDRYFRSGGANEVASGHGSARILGYFPGRSLTVARGSTDADPDAAFRRDVCQFFDERVDAPRKAQFVHRLLGRNMAEVRLFLDRLEHYVAGLDGPTRDAPDVLRELQAIAADGAIRDRYFAFARNSDQPVTRARMIELADALGWLSAADKQAELMRLIGDQYARAGVTAADVELVCSLNKRGKLDDELPQLPARMMPDTGHAALRACLGSADDRALVMQALTSSSASDVQVAQVYFRHHPIDDVNELRDVTAGIAQMTDAEAQVRALNALAQHRLSDRQSLDELTRLFPVARTVNVQRAIAGILIRSDYGQIAGPELLRALREYRLKSPDGQDLIDVLIRRLQLS